jgi:beta-glucanase (GH16 family)
MGRRLLITVLLGGSVALVLPPAGLAHASGRPGAVTSPAVDVTASGALLRGRLRAGGERTTYYFSYGTTSRLDRRTASRSLGQHSGQVSAVLGHLAAHSTYHYQLVVRNRSGTASGRQMTVKTTSSASRSTGATATAATGGTDLTGDPAAPGTAATTRAGAPATTPAAGAVSTPAPGATGTTPVATYDNLVWSDDFAGPAGSAPDSSKWSYDLGAWGASDNVLETDTDSSANVSQDGQGHLAVVARRQTVTGPDGVTRDYTSARVETGGLYSFQYGRIEARMWVPAGAGLWPQLWMLGDNMSSVGWPACGEIDIMEMVDQDARTAYGTIHGPLTDSPSDYAIQGQTSASASLAGGFHTYGVIWQPGRITWTLDGVQYASVSRSQLTSQQTWPFDSQRFHLVLDLSVGGDWAGPPNASTAFPATLLVDWIHVYQ